MRNMHHEMVVVEAEVRSTTKKLTPAGAWLVRHRRVPYDIANYVAELAGFRGEARHG